MLAIPAYRHTLLKGGGDADARSYLAYTPDASATFKSALTSFVVGLKADGLWAGLDWLIVPADTSAGMLRNVRNPAKTASAVNSPTFTAYRGFTGDGATSYIDIGELDTAGGQYTLNSASKFGYVNQKNGADGQRIIAGNVSTPRSTLNTRNTSGSLSFRANDATDSIGATGQTSRIGMRTWSRTSSTSKDFYVESVKTAELSVASTEVSPSNGTILRNVSDYSPDRVALYGHGAGMTSTQVALLCTRVLTFLTAIGAQ